MLYKYHINISMDDVDKEEREVTMNRRLPKYAKMIRGLN